MRLKRLYYQDSFTAFADLTVLLCFVSYYIYVLGAETGLCRCNRQELDAG